MGIDALIAEVIDREGGYSNRPGDRGGETRYGIAEAVARQQGYAGPMRALPYDNAAAIYRNLYWQRPGFDKVAEHAPKLAAELFDTGVNMGPAVATEFLQRALNALNRGASDYPDIAVDGQIGAKTIAALNAFLTRRAPGGETVMIKAVDALQGERYVRLAESRPADEAFLYGWLANRI
jgi:lysozyme family protein